jgi:hypothetical protein
VIVWQTPQLEPEQENIILVLFREWILRGHPEKSLKGDVSQMSDLYQRGI